MGFLGKLFGLKPTDPTAAFPKCLVPPRLVWDTASRTLCGISLPASPDSLAPFGPCERFRAPSKNLLYLSYPSLGLEVEIERGLVRQFTLFLAQEPDVPQSDLVCAKPLVKPAGTVLDSGTTAERLTALFGPGTKGKTFDDGEFEIHFRDGDLCLDATFTEEVGLLHLEIYNDDEA